MFNQYQWHCRQYVSIAILLLILPAQMRGVFTECHSLLPQLRYININNIKKFVIYWECETKQCSPKDTEKGETRASEHTNRSVEPLVKHKFRGWCSQHDTGYWGQCSHYPFYILVPLQSVKGVGGWFWCTAYLPCQPNCPIHKWQRDMTTIYMENVIHK